MSKEEPKDVVQAALEEKGAVSIKYLYPYNLNRVLVVGFEFMGKKCSFALAKVDLDAEKDHLTQLVFNRVEMARTFSNDLSKH